MKTCIIYVLCVFIEIIINYNNFEHICWLCNQHCKKRNIQYIIIRKEEDDV